MTFHRSKSMTSFFVLAALFSSIYTIQGLCPDLWTQYHGSCYNLFHTMEEFAHANFLCKSYNNGHLATVESLGENTMLTNLLHNQGLARHHSAWIGANDRENEGEFRWIGNDQKVSFTYWTSGQPNNHAGRDNCVLMDIDRGYKWNDKPCSNKYFYMCETSPNAIIG